MQELQQLKKLLEDPIFNVEENRQLIADYESKLADLATRERLAGRPGFKEWIKYLAAVVADCEHNLQTNRAMSDKERIEAFITIDQANTFLSYFDTIDIKQGVQDIIKEDLKRVYVQHN